MPALAEGIKPNKNGASSKRFIYFSLQTLLENA